MAEIAKDRFSGFSQLYDNARPVPPEKVCKILLNLLNRKKVSTIVDLGCGTGLSTRIWRSYAEHVIGIEPNDDIRQVAEEKNRDALFLNASSYATTLDDRQADVVCCSQSFHWMEPKSSLQEVARILTHKGIFAAYDCVWPVTVSVASEIAYMKLFQSVKSLSLQYKERLPVERQWPKREHFKHVVESGYFRYCKEMSFDNMETCDSERFIQIALSQGQLQTLLKHGIQEVLPLIEEFKGVVKNDILEQRTMTVSYNMVIGWKK